MLAHFHVLLLFLLVCGSAFGETSDNLCKNKEEVLFSCHTGKKIISVCASIPVTAHSGYVQYRFGKKNAIELVYPSSLLPPYDHFFQRRERYATATSYTHLRFKNGKHSYIVYHEVSSSMGTDGRRTIDENAGVSVIDHHGKRLYLECNDSDKSELSFDEEIFQQDDDVER
jgi:hypothetical protein